MQTEDFGGRIARSSRSRSRTSREIDSLVICRPSRLAVLRRPRIARSRADVRGVARRRTSQHDRQATSMRPAARWCARSATAASCATAFRRRTAARPARSTRARSASSRESLAGMTGSPTSRSRCRASAAGAIASTGSRAAEQRLLPRVARGDAIAAFALSEPDAGSDVAAMTHAARIRRGGAIASTATKTWISNGGIADFYCVFARTCDERRARGASRLSSCPPTRLASRSPSGSHVIAPHPLARLEFDGCRLPADAMLGKPGEGFKLAMRTLDIFRASVGRGGGRLCAARAGRDDRARRTRRMLGGTLGDCATSRGAMLGEMAADRRRARAARLSRRMAARRQAPCARRRKRRWPSCRDRARATGHRRAPCNCMARAAWRAVEWSSACTGRSARCGSTRARPKCRSSSRDASALAGASRP